MKICVLQSGSDGNMTYIETEHHKLVIDVGCTLARYKDSLKNINIEPEAIDTVFITHAHHDHTGCLGAVKRKYNPNIYMSERIYKEWAKEELEYNLYEKEFNIDELNIKCIPLSHDVQCYGFLIECEGITLVYITDTGYINEKLLPMITNKAIYIMESNYDEEMIATSDKNWSYRNRTISDGGHLSNKMATSVLSKIIGDNTKNIVLAHLSKNHNTADLALNTLNDELLKTNKKVSSVTAASQFDNTNIILLQSTR